MGWGREGDGGGVNVWRLGRRETIIPSKMSAPTTFHRNTGGTTPAPTTRDVTAVPFSVILVAVYQYMYIARASLARGVERRVIPPSALTIVCVGTT